MPWRTLRSPEDGRLAATIDSTAAALTISKDAKVQALGTDTTGVAIHVMGGGNTILNKGLISARNAPAIWFRTRRQLRNSIHNEGRREAGNGTTSNVIGSSGSGDVVFVNDVGASVHGSLIFGAGDDTLGLYAGSTISGNVNGGRHQQHDSARRASSNDILTGAITNFQSLTNWRASGL